MRCYLLAYAASVLVTGTVLMLLRVEDPWLIFALEVGMIVGGLIVAVDAYRLGERDEARRAAAATSILIEHERNLREARHADAR